MILWEEKNITYGVDLIRAFFILRMIIENAKNAKHIENTLFFAKAYGVHGRHGRDVPEPVGRGSVLGNATVQASNATVNLAKPDLVITILRALLVS